MPTRWTLIIEQYLAEGRTVSGGKGDSTDQTAEKSSQAFQNTLQQAFSSQFGKQQGTLNILNGKLTSMMNNPTGFVPGQLEAMNTNVIENSASAFQNADKAAQAQEAATGGNELPSGVSAQIQGQLGGQAASALTGQLNQNQIANGQLQQQNQWNAISALNGVAQMENPNGLAGNANEAGSSVAGLSNAYSNSENSGFLNKFTNGLASSLGSGLGGAATGEMGTGASSLGSGNFGW